MGRTLGCSDGNCIWQRPTGMGTNGGCKCTRDLERNTRDYYGMTGEQKAEISSEWLGLRIGIAEQRDRIAELERERDEDGAKQPTLRQRIGSILVDSVCDCSCYYYCTACRVKAALSEGGKQ